MKFAVQVSANPYSSHGAQTAYQFIKAALSKGYGIVLVFFYSDGVYNALPSGGSSGAAVRPPWEELAASHGLDLVVCASASERRGLCAEGARFAPPFRIGGLGQWIDACLSAERVLHFGA